jgi:hypothetical protein
MAQAHGHPVGDVGLQRDGLGQQVRPLAQTGQCHGMNAVARGGQGPHNAVPTPAAMPCPMNQCEIRDEVSPGLFTKSAPLTPPAGR